MFYLAHIAPSVHNYNRELREHENEEISLSISFSHRIFVSRCVSWCPFPFCVRDSFCLLLLLFFLPLSHPRLFFNFSLAVLGGERERWPLAGSSLDAVPLQVSFRMRRRERGPSSIYSIRNDAAKVREYTRLFEYRVYFEFTDII